MKREINIAETEWKIMEVLWQNPDITITEIKSNLSETGWSDSTIKTLVRRLCSKGAVSVDESKSPFVYSPVVSEKECKIRETKSFIDKVYHGSLKLLMANLVTDSSLSRDDELKLMEIIEKMEDGEKQ